MKRILTSVFAVALVCLSSNAFSAEGDLANRNKPPVQVFYNPLPENDVLDVMMELYRGSSTTYSNSYKPISPMYSYTYIAVFCDDTVIYYDQWEDGYEPDLANPVRVYSKSNPLGTQIWGDGDLSNGCAPGTADDRLHPGDIIKLISEVNIDQRGKTMYYDAGDKWGSSKPVAASRTVWASQSKTLLAGANEMYDTSYFGTDFVCPVGTDTVNANEVFEYTGLSVMAGEGGATVEYSATGKEADKVTKMIAEGKTILIGKVKQGGWVRTTSGKVQVELLTGDIYDGFESRFIKILPRSMWNNSYTCPIAAPTSVKSGTTTYKVGAKIWIYNPDASDLVVSYKGRGSTKFVNGTVTIPAKTAKAIVPATGTDSTTVKYTGALSATYLSANRPFYALVTVDSLGTGASSKTGSYGDNRTWDWGCALIPDQALSTQVLVGLGLGCDPNTAKAENAAPIWVAAPEVNGSDSFNASTTVYVKYDKSTSTAPYTDENGNAYDKCFTIHPLEMIKLYNEKTSTADQKKNGQTGMTFWTIDGKTKLASAWGEDPEKATSGDPGIDMGTGVPPMPEIFMQKASRLIDDRDDDGYVSCGDQIKYTIDIINVGRIPITDLKLGDILPGAVTFDENSLRFTITDKDGQIVDGVNNMELDDDVWDAIAAGTFEKKDFVFCRDRRLNVGHTWTFTYTVTVGQQTVDSILNTAWINAAMTEVTNNVTDYLRSKIGDYVWLDENGNGIQDSNELAIPGAKVSLIDIYGDVVSQDNGQPYTAITDSNGHYQFIGVRPGTYQVKVDVPPCYIPTTKSSSPVHDGANDSDIGADFLTDSFVVGGGQTYNNVDAGLKVRDPHSILTIEKTPSKDSVAAGGTVTYTYKVTNTGYTYLKNVTVTDDKLGAIGTVADILAPGESATFTKDAKLVEDTTNVGTVTGIPGGENGEPLVGVPTDPITAEDTAEVTVYDGSAWIGDYVWADLDKDGIQDAGEPGLAGSTVTLKLVTTTTTTKKVKQGTKYVTETVTTVTTNTVDTQVTDAKGYYCFKGLDPTENTSSKKTEYLVSFSNPNSELWRYTTKDAGSDDKKDSDADANGNVAPLTLAEATHNTSIDCGFIFQGNPGIEVVKTASASPVAPGTVVTYTYAVRNTGNTHLANIIVEDDKIPGQSKTIAILAPGATTNVTMSATIVEDTTNTATVTGTPSDPNGKPWADPVTDTDTVEVKIQLSPAKIGDFVWFDVNGDGLQNDSFPASGVTVQLLNAAGDVVQTTTTTQDGAYSFTVLPENLGTYKVKFIAPTGFTFTKKGTGTTTDSDASNSGITDAIVLESGDVRADIDCGLVFNGNASIEIVKTAGDAADGKTYSVEKGNAVTYTYVVKNTGSFALSNVTVTDDILGTVGTVNGVILPGASATLTKTASAVNADVTNIGTVVGTPSDNNGNAYTTKTVTDNDDAVVEVYETAALNGLVWIDADEDGVRDEGEDVLNGVTVTLKDANGTTVGTKSTDANGAYSFTDLVPGDYKVIVTKPANFDFTEKDVGADDTKDSDVYKSNGNTDVITLASGETKSHIDAGLVSTLTSAIEVVKVAGNAADGEDLTVLSGSNVTFTITVKNVGQTTLKNVSVRDETLNWTLDPVIATLAVNAERSFTVTKQITSDFVNTATAKGTPVDDNGKKLGDDVEDSDDASVKTYLLGAIEGLVWIDADSNGVQDFADNDTKKSGVEVKLLDAEGNVVATKYTGDDGSYLFDNLEPGDYKVAFTAPALYSFTDKDVGSNDNIDSDVIPATGVTDKITVGSGETKSHIDAGLVSAGEPKVEIVKLAGDAADGEIFNVKTNASFNYTISVRNSGNTYLKDVVVNDATLNWQRTGIFLAPGAVTNFTIASTAERDLINTATVSGTQCDASGTVTGTTPVEDSDDAEIKVWQPVTIGDFVWIDVDADGVQDATEKGLEGVAVILKDADGKVVKTTETDENGAYSFTDVDPGVYTVTFGQVPGYTYTTKNAAPAGIDSNANPNGVTDPITIESGVDNLTIDCGYVWNGNASVSLVKVAGDAADGEVLTVESGSAVTYAYTVKNTGNCMLVDLTVTDNRIVGNQQIASLAPGASTTVYMTASSITSDTTNTGTVTGYPADEDGDKVSETPVTATDTAVVEVFTRGSIGDFAWVDVNGNGAQDDGEQGLDGVTVSLINPDGTTNTTVTANGGQYIFDNLVPGEYKVFFTEPQDFVFTEANKAGVSDDLDSDATSKPIVVTVASGDEITTIDAGFVLKDGIAKISVVKTAGNADDGEELRVVKGSQVTYTYEITNTGSVALKPVVLVDDKIDGAITNDSVLAVGASITLTKTATLNEDTTNVGTVTGIPVDANQKPLTDDPVSAEDDAKVDVYELGSVGDYVWIDVNGNGVQDDGEQALDGVTVILITADGTTTNSTVTANGGLYKFEDLEPGDYRVEFLNPAADIYTFTKQGEGENGAVDSDADATGKTGIFTVSEGEEKTDVDAGLVLKDGVAAIDIVKLAGEAEDGATLTVANGDVVTYTLITKNIGKIDLVNVIVRDATYSREFNIGALAVGEAVTNTFDATIVDDIVNIASVEGIPAVDGEPVSDKKVSDTDDAKVVATVLTATIGDFVWNDSDGDGVQSAGEIGVYGVTVQLCDAATSNIIATTTTDAKGGYLFTDVIAGEYVIHFVPGSSWSFTDKNIGTAEEDSDADDNGWTAPFTVEAGKDDLTIDCGLVGGVPPGFCDLIEIANKFNAFIKGDFLGLSGDSEGNLLVGGDAYVYDGFTVGSIGPGYGRTRPIAPNGTDAFVVGGSLSEGKRPTINGNIVYGDTYTNRMGITTEEYEVTNSLGEVIGVYSYLVGQADYRDYDLRHVNPVTLGADLNVPEDGSGKSLETIASEIDEFSRIVGALGDTAGTSFWYGRGEWSDEFHDQFSFSGSDTFRNIFSITNETLVNANLTFNVPEGSKIVVNVYSTDVSFEDITVNGANHPERGVDYTKILINFVNATNIVSKWTQFGSVLAPMADKTTFTNGTSVNGFGYFGGDVEFTDESGSEFHDYAFKAFDCSTSDVITQRPSMGVVVTAGNAENGTILDIVAGNTVKLNAMIANTSAYGLTNIMANVFGVNREIASLPAGETVAFTKTIAVDEVGTTVWTVSAAGYSIGSAPYEGIEIKANGSAMVHAVATQEELDDIIRAKSEEHTKGQYHARPDFAIDSVKVSGSIGEDIKPTLTGEVFSVTAVITNCGEVVRAPGKLSVYFAKYHEDGSYDLTEAGSVRLRSKAYDIDPGATVTVTIPGLVMPLDPGYCMLRIEIDSGDEVEELSEGNNHWLENFRLSPILLNISVVEEGVVLDWNSSYGEGYVLYGSSDLQTFSPMVINDKEYVEATPPTNTVLIENGSTEFKFFKIYADAIELLCPPE